MTKRHHLFCTLVVFAYFTLGLSSSLAAKTPNVLFIISDDLGAQSLGCYGNKQCKTPNIDSLAKRAVRFTRTYTQFPVCGPSRAALMSGMYAQSIGVIGNGASSKFTKNLGTRPSMSQHFINNGYYSARVSKIYHMRVPGDITAGVNGDDHEASWTECFNCHAPEQWTKGKHEHLTKERLKPDPERKIHYRLGYGGAFYVVRGSSNGAEQADHKAAAKAIEILKQKASDKEPFFLAVGLVRPHVPLVAPASFFEPYDPQNMQLPKQFENDLEDIPRAGISKSSKSSGLDTKLKKQKVLEAYYASVSYMDAQVGKILNALNELKLRDDTIVVFTADHGYHLGEHEFWQKMSLHEESTRIPLIVHAPDFPPSVSSALSQQIDIYPTLAELAGLSIPDHIQGKSLVRAMKSDDVEIHESVYCLRGKNDHMIRTDRWTYITFGKGGMELYDMKNDPNQFVNLAKSPKHQVVLNEMRLRLAEKLQSMD